MKYSYKILQNFLGDLPPAQEIAELLHTHVCEVEELTHIQPRFTKIVAAKIASINKHPQADKLSVVELYLGAGKTVSPVVCGGKNLAVGAMVAFASPGSYIPVNPKDPAGTGFFLEQATIRGVTSLGMICAEAELGLADDDGTHSVMILPEDTKPGSALEKIISVNDWVFDCSLPANRPDLFSHIGLARVIASQLSRKFTEPPLSLDPTITKVPQTPLAIQTPLSPFGFELQGTVHVQQSDITTKALLKSLGLRSINNVVDISNLARLIFGQPNHCFDLGKLRGSLTIREAKRGESVVTINHKTYAIPEHAIVLADESGPVDIAGIMGGLATEVNHNTKKIAFSSCAFSSDSIRKTSRTLGLKTDSSIVYEKGVPFQTNFAAINFVIKELKTKAGLVPELVKVSKQPKTKPNVISLSPEDVNSLLGTHFTAKQLVALGKRLHYTVTASTTKLKVAVPWYRPDIATQADLAEEIAKLVGYNSITPAALPIEPKALSWQHQHYTHKQRLKQFVVGMGFTELQSYSLISQSDVSMYKTETNDYVKLLNPLSREYEYLRKNLASTMIKSIERNHREHRSLKFFEVGSVFENLQSEKAHLCLMRSGVGNEQKTILELKGELEAILVEAGVSTQNLTTKQISATQGSLYLSGVLLGRIGIYDDEVLQKLGITHVVAYAEVDLEGILQHTQDKQFQSQSKFPEITRDLSIVIPAHVTWATIAEHTKDVSNLLTYTSVFSADYLDTSEKELIFHENLAKSDKKNIGIRLHFRSSEKTLTDEEVLSEMHKIMVKLKEIQDLEIR